MKTTAVSAFVAALGLSVAMARAAAPGIVGWEEAGAHVGQVVTVEGEVRAARVAGDTCVLEFADDPGAFRAVLLLPLFGGTRPRPERVYTGKRIRVTGRVQRFHGRPEIVLRGPEQIELAEPDDVPAAVAPAEAAPAVRSEPPPSLAPAEQLKRTQMDASPCERARAGWRDVAADASARAAGLARCLDAMRYGCRAESAALAPALRALESMERQVEATCR